jgi:hypothetical protein
MKEWKIEEEEIILMGFKFNHDFCLWKVFMKRNAFMYWNIKSRTVDRFVTYTPMRK